MLHKTTELQAYQLSCLDGEMGKAKEFYFDDRSWAIRYLIADTGTWLRGRQVLISPHALDAASREDGKIAIQLSKRQIEESPSLVTDKPVSLQFEEEYHGYYGWSGHWMGGFPLMGADPAVELNPATDPSSVEVSPGPVPKEDWDPHLRSTEEVRGSHIEASDGELGHVEDFIVDDDQWTIRYLVIDTKNWWPGKKVLISPRWIERVSWADSKVIVNLTRDEIKAFPEFTDEALLKGEFEVGLHENYQR